MSRRPADARGLTLVELMVGMAIGLFLVGAAAFGVSVQLHDNRRLMLETQVLQELRAAADIVVRELRRSGHWGLAHEAVWTEASSATPNPYREIDTPDHGTVTLRYSSDAEHGQAENGRVDAREVTGFRLRAGTIQMQVGQGNWQQLTDPATLTVTTFEVLPRVLTISLAGFCAHPCPAGATQCPPMQQVRAFDLRIEGHATPDPGVRRRLQAAVRARNDIVIGDCPA